jgi:hypothetical protein
MCETNQLTGISMFIHIIVITTACQSTVQLQSLCSSPPTRFQLELLKLPLHLVNLVLDRLVAPLRGLLRLRLRLKSQRAAGWFPFQSARNQQTSKIP